MNKLQITFIDLEEDHLYLIRNGTNDILVSIPDFIESQQCDQLSIDDQKKLYADLQEHPKIVCDQSIYGGYSFSINGTQSPLYFLGLAFVASLIICSMMFSYTKQWSDALIMPAAAVLFAMSYSYIDTITEIYGYNRARFTIAASCSLMILCGIAIALFIKQPDYLPDHEAEIYYFVFNQAPSAFYSLAVGMLVADFINIKLFVWLKKMLNNWPLVIRCLISSFTSRLLFSYLGAMSLWRNQMFDSDYYFDAIHPQIISAMMLTVLFTLFTLLLVYGIKSYNRKVFTRKKWQLRT